MLTNVRYTPREVLLWTRYETAMYLAYAALVAGLYVLGEFQFLHLPWAPVAVIGTAVAFIVGFQNNAAYGRIWEARKVWGGIVNTSRTWGMRVMDCVTGEFATTAVDEEELRHQRTLLIHRHLAWLTALRYAMRERRAWETFDECPSNRDWSDKILIPERDMPLEGQLADLLPAEELQAVLGRTNRAAAVISQQSRHLRELKERGWVWDFAFLEMQNTLQQLFDLQGKSERIKNFPYPRQYATIGYQFVRLFVLFIPFAAIPEFAAVGQALEADWPLMGRILVWCAVPFSALMSWIFHVMERIGRVGENPFEGTANDVPISTMSRGIEIDLREMRGEPPESIPDPLPAMHGVQM